MKKILLSLLAFAALVLPSQAITITVGKGLGVGATLTTSTGTVLPAGSFQILVGTFSTAPAAGSTTTANLLRDFAEFGRATTNVANTDSKGLVALTSGVTAAPANAEAFNTKAIYLVVGNGATFEASTEVAVIEAKNPTAGTWFFPANVQAAGSITAAMNSFANFQTVGGYGMAVDAAQGSDTIILSRLIPVPEPSGVLLMALGAMSVALRRRR